MSGDITMTCLLCGASCTDDWEHLREWDVRHEATCPKAAAKDGPR